MDFALGIFRAQNKFFTILKEEIPLRKKIIAGLLALVVTAAPITAMANPHTITTDVNGVTNVIERVSSHFEVINGQTYIPLRATVEAFEGANVNWNPANHNVIVSFNGAVAAAWASEFFGADLTGLILSGNFALELTPVANGLQVVAGPAAGAVVRAELINESWMLPIQPISPAMLVNINPSPIETMLNWNLINLAVRALTGDQVPQILHNVQPDGTINLILGPQPR